MPRLFLWFPRAQACRLGVGTGGRRGGPSEQRCYAGRRPPRVRTIDNVSSVAAVPQVIADTAGSLKSVPLSTACKNRSANAAYARRCSHSQRSFWMCRLSKPVIVTTSSTSTDAAPSRRSERGELDRVGHDQESFVFVRLKSAPHGARHGDMEPHHCPHTRALQFLCSLRFIPCAQDHPSIADPR